MDLEELRGKLESAKESAQSASGYASNVSRELEYAESEADSAYSTIDDILDNLVEYQTMDMDQHRMLIRLTGRLARLNHYLYRIILDGTTGSKISNEDETRLRDSINILDKLFNLDPVDGDGTINKDYVVNYDYNKYAWIIKHKNMEEANNG